MNGILSTIIFMLLMGVGSTTEDDKGPPDLVIIKDDLRALGFELNITEDHNVITLELIRVNATTAVTQIHFALSIEEGGYIYYQELQLGSTSGDIVHSSRINNFTVVTEPVYFFDVNCAEVPRLLNCNKTYGFYVLRAYPVFK